MTLDPLDRRGFLSLTGGAFVCTLAGQYVATDSGKIDVAQLSNEVEVPPKVAAEERSGADASAVGAATAAATGPVREYWIAAEERKWDIVPTHRDQMMAKPIKGKTTFDAYAYRQYSPELRRAADARRRFPGR